MERKIKYFESFTSIILDCDYKHITESKRLKMSDLTFQEFLRKYSRLLAAVLFSIWAAAASGVPVKSDSLRFEILMSNKMLNDIQLDKKFISSIDVTSNRYILLSTNDQFFVLGWGGIVPFGRKTAGNIGSYAYTTDSLLMIIRNNEVCRFDSLGNLIKLYKLPGAGMGISAGKNAMYVYDRNKVKAKYALYVIAKGGKYSKLLDVPSPIGSVTEMNNSILFSSDNGLFSYNIKRKELRALSALPKGKEIKSITVDTLSSRIYFATDSTIYAIKDTNTVIVTDEIGGILRSFHDGLIVFNPEKKLIVRIVGLEKEIKSDLLASKAPANTKIAPAILTNESIINLVKAELSDEFIMKIISKSEVNFNLSVDSMIELSDQNVSSSVIKEMKNAMKRKAGNG